jgi:hypothetical protein
MLQTLLTITEENLTPEKFLILAFLFSVTFPFSLVGLWTVGSYIGSMIAEIIINLAERRNDGDLS